MTISKITHTRTLTTTGATTMNITETTYNINIGHEIATIAIPTSERDQITAEAAAEFAADFAHVYNRFDLQTCNRPTVALHVSIQGRDSTVYFNGDRYRAVVHDHQTGWSARVHISDNEQDGLQVVVSDLH